MILLRMDSQVWARIILGIAEIVLPILIALWFYRTAKTNRANAAQWVVIGIVVFVLANFLSAYLLNEVSAIIRDGKTLAVQRKITAMVLFCGLIIGMLSAYFAYRRLLTSSLSHDTSSGPGSGPDVANTAQPDQTYDAINRYVDGDASWTHLLYFYGFSFLLGGCLLLPLTLTGFAEVWNSQASALYLDMSWQRRIIFCWFSVGIAFFGFGVALKTFSVGRYLAATILLALVAWKTALQGSGGSQILVPIGSGIIGLTSVWMLGNLGIVFSNWIAKSAGKTGLRIANTLGTAMIAVVAIFVVFNGTENFSEEPLAVQPTPIREME